MRLYLIVTGDFVTSGGMDRANYALASYLARRGDDVHLVAHRVADDLLTFRNVTFHRVRKPAGSYFLAGPLLDRVGRYWAKRIAARGGRVIVNGGNCQWGDVNWVHHVHATDPLRPAQGVFRRSKSALTKWIWRRDERRRVPRADVVLTTCQRTKQDIVGALGVPADRVHVVYLGVDSSLFRPRLAQERTQMRNALGWSPDVPHLAFIGAMGDRRKGFDVLYRAWQRLCIDPGWRCRLVVVGRGEDASYWKQRSIDDRLGSRIEFIEFVPNLAEMLACCDAHVLPSRYEGYSMVTHEALCCGVPALVGRNAGIAERYPSSLAELLFDDPTDDREVERRLRGWFERRTALHAAAEEFSGRLLVHTWDVMAEQMVRIIEQPSKFTPLTRATGSRPSGEPTVRDTPRVVAAAKL